MNTFQTNVSERVVNMATLPLRIYPISSWIFFTMGGLAFCYPLLIFLFVIYIVYGCFNQYDDRAFGWILDCIEFCIGYKIALYGTKNKSIDKK